jgi:DNA-binding NarL/FixJ family response regulator
VTHGSIEVVIADDHPVVLQGLVTLLSDEPDFRVVAACQDGTAALEAILKHSPDVALLDLRMPKMTGLDVLGKVANENTRIVILTAFAEDDDVNRGDKSRRAWTLI